MNFLCFILFLIVPNVLNQEDSKVNFYSYDFYIEYNSNKYSIDLYQNNLSESIIRQFPLMNKLLSKETNLMSIELNSPLTINQNLTNLKLKKGDIISDGNKISLYYNNRTLDLSDVNYLLIGNFQTINKLIEIYDNGLTSLYINIINSCHSTIVSYNKQVIINDKKPTFQLLPRKSIPFINMPYIYYSNNNYELMKYCYIESNNISIFCNFDEEFLKTNIGNQLEIIELIPGCEKPINTGIIIQISIENCELLDDFGHCQKCFSGYSYNKIEKKCKKKNKSLFYFLVIGLPIIWVFSIIIHFCLLNYHQEKKYFILLSILLGPLGLIISLFFILDD